MMMYLRNLKSADVATKHISDMTSSFKSKTERFSNDIQSDLKKRSKPILKRSTSTDAGSATDGGEEPRTFREESRLAQYGNNIKFLHLLYNDRYSASIPC